MISASADWMAEPSSVCGRWVVSLGMMRKWRRGGGGRGLGKEKRKRGREGKRTNLIKLNGVEIGVHFCQEGFCGFAVGAPGFAEYGCEETSRRNVLAAILRPLIVSQRERTETHRQHSHQ